MVYVFCTSSYSALHLPEVLWKYLERYQSLNNGGMNDGRADGRTLKILEGIT